MKALIFALLIFVPGLAIAETNSCEPKEVPCPTRLAQAQKEIARLRKERTELKTEVDQLRKSLQGESYRSELLATELKSQQQSVRETVVVKEQRVDVTRPNAVSLMVPYAPTKLVVDKDSSGYSAKTASELDLGLMYQRDFNRIRGSLGLTLKGTGIVGLGVNF